MGIAPEDLDLEFAGCARKTFNKRITFEGFVSLVYRSRFVTSKFDVKGRRVVHRVSRGHKAEVNIFKLLHRCFAAYDGGEFPWLG
jgi:hypothetical protein